MTITINAGPRRRLAALGGVAAAAVLAVVLYGAPAGEGTSPALSPDEVRAAVTIRLTAALEQATPAEHESHGHYDVGGTTRVICAVEVLGFEPADAGRPEQVRTVYANHLCAVSDNGRPWDWAAKTSGPLVAEWGQPPAIQTILQGDGFPERVRVAIPARYHEKALGSVIDEATLAALRTRFDASVAEFWAALKASTPPS